MCFHKSVFEGNSALHLPDPPKLKSMGKKKKKRENLSICVRMEGEGVLQGITVFHMSKFAFITLGFVQRGKKTKISKSEGLNSAESDPWQR